MRSFSIFPTRRRRADNNATPRESSTSAVVAHLHQHPHHLINHLLLLAVFLISFLSLTLLQSSSGYDGFTHTSRIPFPLISTVSRFGYLFSRSRNTLKYRAASFVFSESDLATLERHSFEMEISGQKQTKRKAVIITSANAQVAPFVSNLRCFIRQTSEPILEPVIFSLDENMSMIARNEHMAYVPLHEFITNIFPLNKHVQNKDNDPSYPVPFGSTEFSVVTHSKLWMAYLVLKHGYDVLLTDVDIAWCKDMRVVFHDYVQKYPDIDMFMQSNRRNESGNGQLNTGFYYAKSNVNTLKLYLEIMSEMSGAVTRGQDDQGLFWNVACCRGTRDRVCMHMARDVQRKTLKDGTEISMCVWKSQTKMMYLPHREFPNGFRDAHNRMLNDIPRGYYRAECREGKIAMWHVNFCRGDEKLDHLKRQKMWILRSRHRCHQI